MKKKRISEFLQRLSVGRKVLYPMRLTVILTIFLSMNVFGDVVSQTVSLKLENATLREAFKILKKQTGVYFIFNEEELATDVRLNMKVDNLSLENTVRQILQGLPYDFECLENMVVIKGLPMPRVILCPAFRLSWKELPGDVQLISRANICW